MAYRHTLIIAWGVALCIRLATISLSDTPTVLSDEVDYFLAARDPEGHPDLLSLKYPPLYPLVIGHAARMGDRETGYLLTRIVNALLSSSIVPLTWFLWGGSGLTGGILVGILSPGIITTPLILSENLFVLFAGLWLYSAWRWIQSGAIHWSMLHGCIAGACALTRAAGGAMVIATCLFAFVTLRRSRRMPGISAIFAASVPVLAYLMIRSGIPTTAFNDPLAVQHPSQALRWFSGSLHDLTAGTLLESPARIIPVQPVFAGLWFVYWILQYIIYLLMGSLFLPLVVFAHSPSLQQGRRRLFSLLVLLSVILVGISANHTLAGVQADQFVRGRYLEPLLPLWVAFGLSVLPSFRGISPLVLLPILCADIGALTASQNRSTDILYPLRSIVLTTAIRPYIVIVAASLLLLGGLAVWMRLLAVRRAPGILLAVAVLGLTASLIRYHTQHDIASGDAVIARWLAEHDPDAAVALDADPEAMERAKISGVAWVGQQIRFFSGNPLLLTGDTHDSEYVVSDSICGAPVICGTPAMGRPPDPPCLYTWE